MDIKEKIYEIIELYDGTGEIDECVEEIEEMLSQNKTEVLRWTIHSDTDVFDSCGLDIFYISVAYVDANNELQICGDRLTSG